MADEANALRRAANARAARERRWTPVAWIFLADIPLLALVLVLVARRRDSVPEVPHLLDQPPDEDEAPAALAVAWARVHRRSGSKAAFRAQLLDLVSKHAVELVPKGSVT